MITTVLLCLPGSAFPRSNWLSKLPVDKIVHFTLFSVMVGLWCYAFTNRRPNRASLSSTFVVITLLAIAYGVAMEFIQVNFIPHRSFDGWDIAANTVGSLAGLVMFQIKSGKPAR